jgi:hypothetical protein
MFNKFMKKKFSFISHQGNSSQKHNEIIFIPVRMTGKYEQGGSEKRTTSGTDGSCL